MGRVMCKIAEKASRQFHYDRTTAVQTYLYCTKGRLPKKQRENVGILKKQGGGVYPNPTSIFFIVFNMGDLPKINGKIGKKFPNRGEGGGPRLGKNSHIFPFFFWQRP